MNTPHCLYGRLPGPPWDSGLAMVLSRNTCNGIDSVYSWRCETSGGAVPVFAGTED